MMAPPPSDPKQITHEDVAKLTKAMKDDQFRGYLDEYVKEISDPTHRKEYLQYLAQLEAKDELPEGQALLRCEPGCCVKTTIRFKNGQVQKLFINICHSDRLDDLAMQEKAKDGGRQVNLPYSLSPPRTERDHKDDFCMTCDMAVSTGTFMQSVQSPQILKMLVDIAADGMSSKFLQGHEEVSKDFKLLKKVKCKGGEPMPMSVRGELLKGSKKPKKPVDTGGYDGVTPSELKQMRDDAKKKKEEKKQAKAQEDIEEVEKSKPPKKEEEAPARIRVPKHRLVHSGTVDLADYMSNNPEGQAGPTTTVPKLLKLIVELPTVKKSSDISLEVTNYNVVVEVADKYYLDLPLSYEIEDSNGVAKFDKAKQSLTLELPVVPKAPDPSAAASLVTQVTGDDDYDGGLNEGHASDEEEEALPPLEPDEQGETAEKKEDAPSSVVEESPTSHAEEVPPVPASPAKKSELLELCPEGGSLRIAHAEPPAAEEATAEPALPSEDAAETLADRSNFIAADCFQGAKAGYYFSRGEEGLGYYLDSRQSSRQVAKKKVHFTPECDTRPLVEEVTSSFTMAPAELPPRPPLAADLQLYLEATSALATRVPASSCDAACNDAQHELPLDWHQTRQNVVLSISIPDGHSISDVQVRFARQIMVVTLYTRPAGDAAKLWQRHCIRTKLCGLVDARQWNAEIGAGVVNVVIRKDPAGMWTEIVDSSAPISNEATATDTPAASLEGGAIEDNGSGLTKGLAPIPADIRAGDCETALADPPIAADVDSAELDAVAPTTEGSTSKDRAQMVVGSSAFHAKATAAMVQSATVMGHGVLLRNRLMYQLL